LSTYCTRLLPRPTLFPYTTLFRSCQFPTVDVNLILFPPQRPGYLSTHGFKGHGVGISGNVMHAEALLTVDIDEATALISLDKTVHLPQRRNAPPGTHPHLVSIRL